MSTTLSHVWKPSHARLVTIDSFIPVPRGSSATAPPPLNWPTRDPGDILDYILDIGPAIVGNDGDGIATGWPLVAKERASSCSFAFRSGVSSKRNRYDEWGSVNRSEWKSRIVQLVCSIHLGLHHASRTHTCYCGQPYPPKQGARRTITYAHD